MKFKTFVAIALVVMLSLAITPVVSAQEVVPSSTDDTAGVFLFSAGLSAGTADAPTGQPAGAPTDDIVTAAISFGLLEFVGDVPEEIDSWSYGAVEGQAGYGQVDTTEAEVIEGLTTVDDFGFLTEGGDDAANFDAGTGGCFVGGLRAIPSVRDALVIVPDGVPATGTMGPSGAGDAGAAEAALDGYEIFIFDDGELSGMEIILSSPSNNIVIGIGDRQINPNTAAGADDTLIAIDLDTLDGFDGTFIDTISICDDGVVMTAPPPIFGDTSLEIDAIAARSLASQGEIKIIKEMPCCWCGPCPEEVFTFQALQGGEVKGEVTMTGAGEAIIGGLAPGTYNVCEILEADSAYQQQPCQEVTVAAGETATVTFRNELYNPGKIKIIKEMPCCKCGSCPKEVFTFQAIGEDGEVKGEATITAPGWPTYAYISGLAPGTYNVCEVLQKGSAYQQQPCQEVTVEAGETARVTFHNKLEVDEQGKIKIIKEMPCCWCGSCPEEVFTFEAWKDGEVKGTASITGSGYAYINDLDPGTYTVKEILQAGSAYQQPEDQTVTVEAGETARVYFSNKLEVDETGKIRIVKRWESWWGPRETFTFQALQGGVVKGEATINGPQWWAAATISGLEPGTYTVKEILQADSAYQQPDDQTVTVEAGETARVYFKNKLEGGCCH